LAAIAEDAGVHPSAVRRYFDSREDILLTLAAEAWQEWAAGVAGELARLSNRAQIGGVLARSLAERPLFCDLLAHASLTLEREVPLESARLFKVAALDAAESVAEAIGGVDAALAGQAARDVVAAASALGAMLWQYADPPEVLQRLYAEDPRLAHTMVDFVPRLTRLLDQLIAGAILLDLG
jgi:AcrR family transcriptional regulator